MVEIAAMPEAKTRLSLRFAFQEEARKRCRPSENSDSQAAGNWEAPRTARCAVDAGLRNEQGALSDMNAGVIPVTMGGDGSMSQPLPAPRYSCPPRSITTYREIMAILRPRIDFA